MNCIDVKRADDYNDWWRIGQAFYNIDYNKGFLCWSFFSKKCPEKYDEEVIKQKWREFERNYSDDKYKYNLVFIKKIACEDNIERYKKVSQIEKY